MRLNEPRLLREDHNLITGVKASCPSPKYAVISMSLQADGYSAPKRFVLTPQAALELSRQLKKSVKDYLNVLPNSEDQRNRKE